MDILGRFYSKYILWKDKRFLKKHGCENWDQYNHRFDPDINIRATHIKDYYMNYPYVFVFTDTRNDAFRDGVDEGCELLKNWCKENCKGKWRTDIHRVLPRNLWQASDTTDYDINDIGGYDFLFFGFTNEQDYIWFSLKWQ